MKKVSIGILAWNEATTLPVLFDHLSCQTLFDHEHRDIEVELIVVANGCTDDTVSVAKKLGDKFKLRSGNYRVEDLSRPGKANAWNEFVHRFSAKNADVLVLIDADITLDRPACLETLVGALVSPMNGRAVVSAATPQRRPPAGVLKRWINRGARQFSRMEEHAQRSFICGMLYAGRSDHLRNIHLPDGILGDDAALMYLTVTNMVTRDCDFSVIVHPPGTDIYFEPYLSVSKLFKQHRRRLMQGVIDGVLYRELARRRSSGDNRLDLLVQLSKDDAGWFKNSLREAFAGRFWLIPADHALPYLYKVIRFSGWKKVAFAPLGLIGTLWSIPVAIAANVALKSGWGNNIWAARQNTTSRVAQ